LRQVRESLNDLRDSGIQLDKESAQTYSGMRRHINALIGGSEGLRVTGTRVKEVSTQFRGMSAGMQGATALLTRELMPALTLMVSSFAAAIVSIRSFQENIADTRGVTEFVRQTNFARETVRGLSELGKYFEIPPEQMKQMLAKMGAEFTSTKFWGNDFYRKMVNLPEARAVAVEITNIMSNIKFTDEEKQDKALKAFQKFLYDYRQAFGEADLRRVLSGLGLDEALAALGRIKPEDFIPGVKALAASIRELDPASVEKYKNSLILLERNLHNLAITIQQPVLNALNDMLEVTNKLFEAKPGEFWLVDKLREAATALKPIWDDIKDGIDIGLEEIRKLIENKVWPKIKIDVGLAIGDLKKFAEQDWLQYKTTILTVYEQLTNALYDRPIDWGKILALPSVEATVKRIQAFILTSERRILEFQARIGTGSEAAAEAARTREREFLGENFPEEALKRYAPTIPPPYWVGTAPEDAAKGPHTLMPEGWQKYNPLNPASPYSPLNPKNIERENQIFRFSGGGDTEFSSQSRLMGGLRAADAFRQGGIMGLGEHYGMMWPSWMQGIATVARSPLMGYAGYATPGMLTPGAGGAHRAAETALEGVGGAINWGGRFWDQWRGQRSRFRGDELSAPASDNIEDARITHVITPEYMQWQRQNADQLTGPASTNLEDRRPKSVFMLEEGGYLHPQSNKDAKGDWAGRPRRPTLPNEGQEFGQFWRTEEDNTRALKDVTQELRRFTDLMLRGGGVGGIGGIGGGGGTYGFGGGGRLGAYAGGGGGSVGGRTGSPWYGGKVGRAVGNFRNWIGADSGGGRSGPGPGGLAQSTDYDFAKTMAATGLDRPTIDAVRAQLQDKESNYNYGLNDQSSGARGNFGAYQYNEEDVAAAAKYFGENAPSREQLLKNPALQEKYLEGYWMSRIQMSGLDKTPEFQSLKAAAAGGDIEARNKMATMLISQQTSMGREAIQGQGWRGDAYHGSEYWMRGFAGKLASARGTGGTNWDAITGNAGGAIKMAGTGQLGGKDLQEVLEFAGRSAGVNTEITSGLEGGHSARHLGLPGELGAHDVRLRDPVTGQLLDSRVPADRVKMYEYIKAAAASGATGIGTGRGSDYMGPHGIHIGGGPGPETVWGAHGAGANAPDWARQAFNKGRAAAMSPQQRTTMLARQRELARNLPEREPGQMQAREPIRFLGRDPGTLSARAAAAQKIEGSADLNVNVNAPRGTKVSAETDGKLFKDVKMNRKLSEQPAAQQENMEE
jgi:hypothetical protein